MSEIHHRVRAIAALVLVLLAAPFAAAVEAAHPPNTPAEVVAEFCKLDFEGGQLTNEGWRHMSNLFTWADAPGWDDFTVVKSYKVVSSNANGNRGVVTVEFQRIGKLSDEPVFTQDVATEEVTFQLIHTMREWKVDADGGPKKIKPEWSWKIQSPQKNPHISCESAAKQIQSLDESGQDSVKAIEQMKAACKDK